MSTISQNLIALTSAKTNIATAISEKGVEVPTGSGFNDFPELINSISTGGGTTPSIRSLSVGNCSPSITKIAKRKTWVNKSWSGYSSLYGSYIWNDGTNIYYSDGSYNKVLDISTSTWSNKTWYGLTSFKGDNVWSDGDNIYYTYYKSPYAYNYVLNVSTATWETKSWYGYTPKGDSFGQSVWSDGINIYMNSSYILDKPTSTWSAKTWYGLTSFEGRNIWTDGTNIYYSGGDNSTQYILDVDTSTWNYKQWYGTNSIYGQYIWSDGYDIFHSDNYVLNKETSKWETFTQGLNSPYYGVWTDGSNIYYSAGGQNKILTYTEDETLTSDFNTPTCRPR